MRFLVQRPVGGRKIRRVRRQILSPPPARGARREPLTLRLLFETISLRSKSFPNQNLPMKNRLPLAALLLLTFALVNVPPVFAQPGVGARYGARDPVNVASTKAPKHGAPTAAQARAYLISGLEHEKGSGTLAELYLTEDVKLEIGKGRPYEHPEGGEDIDTKALVYPVRGSYTYYTCYPINVAHPAGKNCKKVEFPNAAGICYKTTFGDWKVLMTDITTRKVVAGYFPPPK
jgi:hypothetical protein